MTEKLDMDAWQTLTRDLCAYPCGANTPGNTQMFQRLCGELPFTIHEYPALAEYNGWIVPERWHVEKAEVRKDGAVLFDGCCHPLAVAALSRSFSGRLSRENLEAHLVTNSQLPEAYTFHCQWQYRPWAADWALCVPWALVQHWGPGLYDIDLVTRRTAHPMQVAEYTHHGDSPQTFVFQAHTCHPCQSEDGFGAVALLVKLFQSLRERKTRFTYKLLLGPEHLGTVFWLKDKSREELKQLCGGCFMEMPGVDGPLKLGATLLGEQYIDKIIAHTLRQHAPDALMVPWRGGAGNDETVWEAPGYEVPFAQLTRSRRTLDDYRHFDGYHSSLDTPQHALPEKLQETFSVLLHAISILENNATPLRCFDGLICLANPKYNLYPDRYDPSIHKDGEAINEKMGRLQDYLLRYFDGSMTLLDIAQLHDLPFSCILDIIHCYEQKSLVHLRPYTPKRSSITRTWQISSNIRQIKYI